MSLYAVQATLILSNDGERLLAKYYTVPGSEEKAVSLEARRDFETRLAAKTKGVNGDVLILDGHLIVYKQLADVLVYLLAPLDESESLVYSALITLRDVIEETLQHRVDKANVLDKYDCVALAVDSVIDNGVILCTDSRAAVKRITTGVEDDLGSNTVDFSENGLKSMLDFAKGRIAQAVRQQF